MSDKETNFILFALLGIVICFIFINQMNQNYTAESMNNE
jgi:hypothetical protein